MTALATAAEPSRPWILALLAEAYGVAGYTEEGFRVLAEFYGWFTEGFDTKDLQEAKALLEELA